MHQKWDRTIILLYLYTLNIPAVGPIRPSMYLSMAPPFQILPFCPAPIQAHSLPLALDFALLPAESQRHSMLRHLSRCEFCASERRVPLRFLDRDAFEQISGLRFDAPTHLSWLPSDQVFCVRRDVNHPAEAGWSHISALGIISFPCFQFQSQSSTLGCTDSNRRAPRIEGALSSTK